jgi:1-acyl-sn-glycerol-3-phosphate acyltransferase
MKALKNILGAIWAVWTILIFVSTMLVIIIPILLTYFIPEPAGVRIFGIITQIWMIVFLNLAGCPFRFYGKGNFKKGKNYVVVANHSSLMDVPLLTPFLPGGNKTIAKRSMAKTPLFGWIYTRGSVLVDRDSDASRRHSYEAMRQVLKTGLHMVLYPEGTRNRTGQPLKTFYDGAFRLAIDAQKDVIPVCLFGTATALPPHKKFYFRPTFLRIYILPAIPVQGHTATSLKQASFDVMWKFIEEKRKR